jgi:serine/threonine protein kinase
MLSGDLVDGRFVIGALAGAGGMGRVFRATDRTSGEQVAFKVLLDGRGAAKDRFEREARALSDLRHPGIVRHVAHGQTGSGEPYLAMEWLEGEDLSSFLQRTRLDVGGALALAFRAAEALGAAHARGVVHRDLKPSNLFLVGGRPEQVKILDFGIAHLGDATRLTRTGTVVGTAGYMAPEQASSGESPGPAADVFSLGCVLFECLTGTGAFSGAHVMALLAKVLFEEAPRVSALWPEVPAALDALVARMLAKKPSGRPRDGAALAAELLAIQAGAPPPPAATSSEPPARRISSLTGSEQRVVTLLFIGQEPVELGSTAPAGTAVDSPEHAEMRRVLSAHGGTLQIFADGSAIGRMAKVTGSAKDQAARAARCALALAAMMPERPVVLATGRAETADRPALGAAADRAAGLLAAAQAAGARQGVAIDDVTAGLLEARFVVELDEAGAHWLCGERDTLSGARLLLGKPTPCVGREVELSTLEAIWAECHEEGRPALALVTAPAGMGKSRLAHELVRRIRQRDGEIVVWTGIVDSVHAGSAFGLLGHALRGALGLRDGEPLAARRGQLRARLQGLVAAGDHQRVTELLGELVGTPFPDDESLPLRAARRDAQLMAEQMRRAWLDFLRAEAGARRVLLVLEDLHWGDLPTVRFIDAALRELPDLPWMVLALARPEVHDTFPRLWAERTIHEIRLKELARKASERLVREVVGRDVAPELCERIVAQAGGNAFYLEELIRAVAQGKGGTLPETVLAMVQSRLEGLPPEARRALRAASVFGEVSWRGGIEALLGAEPATGMGDRVDEQLTTLVEREVLLERSGSRFPGERELAFRHALLREGAYSMLTDTDRKLGHRLAGEWLEARGERDALVLAGHFARGDEAERAAQHYLYAAVQASRGGDTTSAVAHASRGLDCGAPADVRIELLGALCEAHTWRVETAGAALPHAEELLRIATPGSPAWASAAFVKFPASVMAGNSDAVLDLVRTLLALETSTPHADALVLPLGAASVALDLLGEIETGNAVMERMAMLRTGPFATMWWHGITAMRRATAGDAPHDALLHGRIGAAMVESMGHQRLAVIARAFEGMNLFYLGAFDAAARALADSAASDEEASLASSNRRFCLAWMLADRGALDDARAVAEELATSGRARGVPLEEGRGRWVLAEALCRRGALAEAEREAQAALSILGKASALDHPGALATLAAVRLAQGRPAEARAAAEEAFSRYQPIGACAMFRAGHLRLVHAECLDATGDRAAARAAIAGARERIQRIAAEIDDPEYCQSFLHAVPENARTLALSQRWAAV